MGLIKLMLSIFGMVAFISQLAFAETAPWLDTKRAQSPQVSFRLSKSHDIGNTVNFVVDNDEFDLSDETGFLSTYVLATYLVKRQVHIRNWIFLDKHKVETKGLIDSLDMLNIYLGTKPSSQKAKGLVSSLTLKLKKSNKIEAAELLQTVLEIEESILTDAKLQLTASKRAAGDTKWSKPLPLKQLSLPTVADGNPLQVLH